MKNTGRSILRSLIDTGDGIQASGISDIGQTLGNYFDQKCLVIAQVHIAFGMCDELRLTSALSGKEIERDHLPKWNPVAFCRDTCFLSADGHTFSFDMDK